jgi:hypothetical protein
MNKRLSDAIVIIACLAAFAVFVVMWWIELTD